MKNAWSLLTGIFVLALVLIALSPANPMFTAPAIDSGSFMYAGNQLLKGQSLYIDVWDHKGPGVFFFNALGLWLGGGSRWGIWWLEFFSLCVSAFILFQFARQAWGYWAAVAGSILWLVSFSRMIYGGNYTEEYSLLFNLLALGALGLLLQRPEMRWPVFAIGLMACFSAMFRPNNAGMPFVIILTLLADALFRRDGKALVWRASAILMGGLTGLGLIAGYFLWRGSFSQFMIATFFYNFSYIGDPTHSQSSTFWGSLLQGEQYLGIFFWLTALSYLFVLWQLFLDVSRRVFRPLTLLLLLLWPIEIYLSGLSGRNVLHYFICWAPALGLTFAFAIGRLPAMLRADWLFPALSKYAMLWMLLILAGIFVFSAPAVSEYVTVFTNWVAGHSIESTPPIVDYVRRNTQPTESVLVWTGQAGINFMAGRESPTPYTFYPWFVDSPYTETIGRSFYEDLVSHPPVLIVDTQPRNPDQLLAIDAQVRKQQLSKNRKRYFYPPYLDEVFAFIDQNYHFEGSIDNYNIYRLNMAAP